MAERRVPGLGLELIELAHALESVRLMTNLTRERAFPSVAEARVAPRAASATVSLVSQRLQQLAARLSNEAEAEVDEAGDQAPPVRAAAGRARRR